MALTSGKLRTPLTNYYRADGVPYGLDNGCFLRFDQRAWERLLDQAEDDRPVFVTLPDIVGDALRTLELFEYFKLKTNEVPRALVLHDGIERTRIPWDDIAAELCWRWRRIQVQPRDYHSGQDCQNVGALGSCWASQYSRSCAKLD